MGCLLAVNSLAVYLPVRVTSALLGTATAWVVGRLAAELAPERPAAAPWATALYAVNYLVGRDGHFAVSDALLCFEISLALLCCARAVARDPRWLAAAAFFAGTAFATKYSAIGLLFPCAAAAVELSRRAPARAGGRRPSRWPPDWLASCWWRRTSQPTGRRFAPVWSVTSAAITRSVRHPGRSLPGHGAPGGVRLGGVSPLPRGPGPLPAGRPRHLPGRLRLHVLRLRPRPGARDLRPLRVAAGPGAGRRGRRRLRLGAGAPGGPPAARAGDGRHRPGGSRAARRAPHRVRQPPGAGRHARSSRGTGWSLRVPTRSS